MSCSMAVVKLQSLRPALGQAVVRKGIARPCTHSHMHTPMVPLFYSTAADTELTRLRIFLGKTVQWSGNKTEAHLG